MASSLSTVSVFDAHRFRKAHNEQLFDSYARRRKVIPGVDFNLEEDEYPEIIEQIALRGWRRLAAPRTDIRKLLVQEFYANAAVSDEEAVVQEELPYKSFVRGKEIDFSRNNIRRLMRFKRETAGAQIDYKTRQALNQRLDEVLANLYILGATWKLSSSQPPVPIQLRRTELQPLARGFLKSDYGASSNVEKVRPLFHGFLNSDYGASSSSQVDPEEPVPCGLHLLLLISVHHILHPIRYK
ncbi:hypothetical protein PIB30_089527, partial [Stylosanthes scabra]|nr:hypothetical protein [Stylosanthes scabra]